MKQHELSVLANVIGVARRELADMDDDDIPAKLRRVAASAARTLPPPYARSVVTAIEENERFRIAVRERWESEGIDDAVGQAFLDDPEAGAQQVDEQAEMRSVADLTIELERSRKSILSLERKLEESKRRLSEARLRYERDLADLQESDAVSRQSLILSVRNLEAGAAGFDAERKEHTDAVEALRSEINELTVKLTRSVTKNKKKVTSAPVAERRASTPPADPVEFAAWLDDVERSQRTYREAKRFGDDASRVLPPLRVPSGLLPDTRQALDALIEQRPDVIYIDGYNVAAMLVENFGDAAARAMVTAKADRLASASKAQVIVVFDAVDVDGRAKARSRGLAEVRFTTGQIADDEIVELMDANPSRAALISSDRELSVRCADRGCVTVLSEAFVQWAEH